MRITILNGAPDARFKNFELFLEKNGLCKIERAKVPAEQATPFKSEGTRKYDR